MNFWFHLFPILGFVGYFLAACGYLAQLLPRPYAGLATSRRLLIVGLLGHVLFLCSDSLFSPSAAFFGSELLPNFPLTLSLIVCIAVTVFLIVEKRYGISMVGAFLAPLAMVFMLLSAILFHADRSGLPRFENSGLLWLHIGLTVMGHAAFLLAFGVSVALIVQESLLKSKKFSDLQRRLPSLRLLDRLNAQLLSGGVLLMGSGIVLGLLFGWHASLDTFSFSSRVVWSFITLTVYSGLLVAMMVKGFRGRRAAWLSVVGFCTVVGSFVSTNIVGSGFHVH